MINLFTAQQMRELTQESQNKNESLKDEVIDIILQDIQNKLTQTNSAFGIQYTIDVPLLRSLNVPTNNERLLHWAVDEIIETLRKLEYSVNAYFYCGSLYKKHGKYCEITINWR